MERKFLYKVYRKDLTDITQRVLDGDFEGYNDSNYSSYWQSVGTPTYAYRTRNDAHNPTGFCKAVSLNGTDSGILLASISQGGGSDASFTGGFSFVMRWYKANWNDGLTQYFLNWQGVTLSANVSVGKLRATTTLGGTVQAAEYNLSSISAGWHTIGIGSDGQYIRLYIDGVEVANYNAGSNVGITDGLAGFSAIVLGRNGYFSLTNMATGYVDFFYFFNGLLSATEMEKVAVSKLPIYSKAKMLFDLNEGTGGFLYGYFPADQGAILQNFTIGNAGGTWVDSDIYKSSSVVVKTSIGGSSEQGIEQTSTYACYVSGLTTYTASAYVKATSGETIKLTVTPTGGGTASNTTITANGSWQLIKLTYTTSSGANRLAIKITITNAAASVKTFWIDHVCLNDGSTAYDYFDGDLLAASGVYSFNSSIQAHQTSQNVYTYLLTWGKEVISEFQYPQEINTLGSSITVKLQRTKETYGEGYDVDFGNEIRVFEYDSYDINGEQVFTGQIANFATDDETGVVTIEVLPYGIEAKTYLFYGGSSRSGFMPIENTTRTINSSWSSVWICQEILPIERKLINSIKIKIGLSAPTSIMAYIYEGSPANNLITVIGGQVTYDSGSNQFIAKSSSVQVFATDVYEFEFPNMLLDPNRQYFFSLLLPTSVNITIVGSGADDYRALSSWKPIGRAAYGVAIANNTSTGTNFDAAYPQMYMELLSPFGTSITAKYEQADPIQMIRDAADSAQVQGSNITWDEASLPLSGAKESYTFVSASLEAVINKAMSLLPAGYYYYFDQSKLTVRQRTSTAAHTFHIGKHIKEFPVEKRSSNIINYIPFVGGELSTGTNFFKVFKNESSMRKYGAKAPVGGAYIDNRVTRLDTATTIANNLLDTYAYHELRGQPSLVDYDFKSIKPGDVVAFRGTNVAPDEVSLWDVGKWDTMFWDYKPGDYSTIRLQVARVNRTNDSAVLTLSSVPVDSDKLIQKIGQSLNEQQTINNPETETTENTI